MVALKASKLKQPLRSPKAGRTETRPLSIPTAVTLGRSEAWADDGPRKYKYAIRFNCVTKDSPIAGSEAFEILGDREVNARQMSGQVRKLELDITEIDLEKLLKDVLLPESKLLATASILGRYTDAKAHPDGVFGAKPKVARQVAKVLMDGLRDKMTVDLPPTRTRTREFAMPRHPADDELHHDPGSERLLLHFEKRALEVHLVYLDFLYVRYHLYGLQTRYRREKFPPYVSSKGSSLRNEVTMRGVTLARFEYYQATGITIESRDDLDEDPAAVDAREVTIHLIEKTHGFQKDRYPNIPSLHMVSNHAFPLKADVFTEPLSEAVLGARDAEDSPGSGWFWSLAPEVRRHLKAQHRSRRSRRRRS